MSVTLKAPSLIEDAFPDSDYFVIWYYEHVPPQRHEIDMPDKEVMYVSLHRSTEEAITRFNQAADVIKTQGSFRCEYGWGFNNNCIQVELYASDAQGSPIKLMRRFPEMKHT